MTLGPPPNASSPGLEGDPRGKPLNSIWTRWFSSLYNQVRNSKSGTIHLPGPSTPGSITVQNGQIVDWVDPT